MVIPLMFPKVPQSCLGILRVPVTPSPVFCFEKNVAPGVSPKPSIVLKLVSPMAPGIRDEWNDGVSVPNAERDLGSFRVGWF